MISRPKYSQVLDPAIRKIFDDAYSVQDTKYDKIFNINTSKKNIEYDGAMSGLNNLSLVSELGEIPVADPVQGFQTTYTHAKFGKAIQISDEAMEDDQHNIIKRKPQALAVAAKRSLEQNCSNVFNFGYVSSGSSFVPGGDGKQLFSIAHPYETTGTFANTFTSTGPSGTATQLALSNTSLQAAQYELSVMKDEFGNPISAMADTLVVSPKNAEAASALLFNKVKPGATNNEMNMRNYDVPGVGQINKLIVWQWLGTPAAVAAGGVGADTWFILDSSQHQLNFFWRRQPSLSAPEYDPIHEATTWKLSMRFSVGWSNPRFIFGSKGDASTFAA